MSVVPDGYCQCGCGRETPIDPKGRTRRFVCGHNGRLAARERALAKMSLDKNGQPQRLCTMCNTPRPISEFNKSRTRSEHLRAHCKSCERKAAKDFYKKNPEPYKRRAAVSRRNMAKKNKELANKIKQDSGCVSCGENTLCVLDFHHLHGNSKGREGGMPVSRAANVSIRKFRAELAKCVVLCANCHRKVHAGLITLT